MRPVVGAGCVGPAAPRLIALALIFLVLQSGIALANPTGTSQPMQRAAQKQAAETARAQLQQKLGALKQAIDNTEGEKARAADALAKSEIAISKASRALRELDGEQVETQARLTTLTVRLQEQKTLLATRQAQLANLLRQQHLTSNEEPIPLLLSGEEPASIGRSMRYLGYVAQAQAKLLGTIRADLEAIEQNQAQLQVASADLTDIASQSRTEKTRLEGEQTQRAQLLKKLASQLASQRAEAGALQRDEARLGGLVEQLGKLIAQQQKAEAVAVERRRQQALKRAAAKEKITSRRVKPADTSQNTSTSKKMVEEYAPKATLSSTFLALKGQLRTPVRGELVRRFGSRRSDGPSWKGWFFNAPEGTPVHAVAAGQVVFSDWLRGFGNLIILDHGDQYLTIYGNNQAALKHAGDKVSAGEIIGAAGNTGGNEESGLYFEMRYQGRAFDPLGWVTSR